MSTKAEVSRLLKWAEDGAAAREDWVRNGIREVTYSAASLRDEYLKFERLVDLLRTIKEDA